MNILSAKSRFASYDITSVSYICIILSASASNCFKSDVSALPKTALFGMLFRFVHLNNQKPTNCMLIGSLVFSVSYLSRSSVVIFAKS